MPAAWASCARFVHSGALCEVSERTKVAHAPSRRARNSLLLAPAPRACGDVAGDDDDRQTGCANPQLRANPKLANYGHTGADQTFLLTATSSSGSLPGLDHSQITFPHLGGIVNFDALIDHLHCFTHDRVPEKGPVRSVRIIPLTKYAVPGCRKQTAAGRDSSVIRSTAGTGSAGYPAIYKIVKQQRISRVAPFLAARS